MLFCQAAAAFESLSLDASAAKKPIIDDARRSHSPESQGDELQTAPIAKEEDVEEWRKRFIGDVDLPEREYDFPIHSLPVSHHVHVDMEPLLMESKRRFVLFPIQYHEVNFNISFHHTSARTNACINASRSGKCTRRLKLLSGPLRRWISPRTSTTGTTA